jgi:hypothetical protein
MIVRSCLSRGWWIAAALGLALIAASAAVAATMSPPEPLTPFDAGTFRVYQKDQYLGTEDFWMAQTPDSLLVRSHATQVLPRPGSPPDTLEKYAELLMGAEDHGIRTYVSQQVINRDPLRREITMQDTTYTSTRTRGLGGFTDMLVRPPGRLYIVDPQVFALFDVVLRDVGRQAVDEREVSMIYLAGRDTTAEALVKHMGRDTVRIGARRYAAEKYSISDAWSQFFAWTSPTGQMLKFTMPLAGLRVERDAKTLTPRGVPKITGKEFVPSPGPYVVR